MITKECEEILVLADIKMVLAQLRAARGRLTQAAGPVDTTSKCIAARFRAGSVQQKMVFCVGSLENIAQYVHHHKQYVTKNGEGYTSEMSNTEVW